MPDNEQKQLSHLFITETSTTELYTSPNSGRDSFRYPQRQRESHGQKLLQQFDTIRGQAQTDIQEQRAYGIDARNGIYLQFESDPEFDLKTESLEIWGSGIELLSEHKVDNRSFATVFVPEGKLDILVNKFSAYLDPEKDSPGGKPRNEPLVSSIASISKAALEALWTDTPGTIPDDEEIIWWEVWLRTGEDPVAELNFFSNCSQGTGYSREQTGLRITTYAAPACSR